MHMRENPIFVDHSRFFGDLPPGVSNIPLIADAAMRAAELFRGRKRFNFCQARYAIPPIVGQDQEDFLQVIFRITNNETITPQLSFVTRKIGKESHDMAQYGIEFGTDGLTLDEHSSIVLGQNGGRYIPDFLKSLSKLSSIEVPALPDQFIGGWNNALRYDMRPTLAQRQV